MRTSILFLSVVFLLLGLIPAIATADTDVVVVTTSLLETAVYEVLPPEVPIEVIRLLSPSACPGHFDLSPRIIPVLRAASLVIRHDYQGVLEKNISRIGIKAKSIQVVTTDSTPLIPCNYYSLVEQVGAMNKTLFPARAHEINASVVEAGKRTKQLNTQALNSALLWKGTPIIAAAHIKEFCEWLGFDVIGVLNRPEETTPRDMENLVKLDADMIVCNLQEGSQAASSLSNRMDIPVVILSNFPGAVGFGKTYYNLIEENIVRLEAVCRKQ